MTPFSLLCGLLKTSETQRGEKNTGQNRELQRDAEAELEKELSDLIRRIENLEILLKSRKGSKE